MTIRTRRQPVAIPTHLVHGQEYARVVVENRELVFRNSELVGEVAALKRLVGALSTSVEESTRTNAALVVQAGRAAQTDTRTALLVEQLDEAVRRSDELQAELAATRSRLDTAEAQLAESHSRGEHGRMLPKGQHPQPGSVPRALYDEVVARAEAWERCAGEWRARTETVEARLHTADTRVAELEAGSA